MFNLQNIYGSIQNADSKKMWVNNEIFIGHCMQFSSGFVVLASQQSLMASLATPHPSGKKYGFRQNSNYTHLNHYFISDKVYC